MGRRVGDMALACGRRGAEETETRETGNDGEERGWSGAALRAVGRRTRISRGACGGGEEEALHQKYVRGRGRRGGGGVAQGLRANDGRHQRGLQNTRRPNSNAREGIM